MNKKRFLLEGRDILKLAWPLLVAQITQMLMGVSDTIMAGRYSATDMAAVALARLSLTKPAGPRLAPCGDVPSCPCNA